MAGRKKAIRLHLWQTNLTHSSEPINVWHHWEDGRIWLTNRGHLQKTRFTSFFCFSVSLSIQEQKVTCFDEKSLRNEHKYQAGCTTWHVASKFDIFLMKLSVEKSAKWVPNWRLNTCYLPLYKTVWWTSKQRELSAIEVELSQIVDQLRINWTAAGRQFIW